MDVPLTAGETPRAVLPIAAGAAIAWVGAL